MRQRRPLALEGPDHPAAERADGKCQIGQHVVKQRILFVAVPAAPGADQFALNRSGIQVYRDAEKRIEALERNLRQMAIGEVAQHAQCWPG